MLDVLDEDNIEDANKDKVQDLTHVYETLTAPK
jgi:hypothetical protein